MNLGVKMKRATNLDSKTELSIDIINGRFSLSLYVGIITLYFIVADQRLSQTGRLTNRKQMMEDRDAAKVTVSFVHAKLHFTLFSACHYHSFCGTRTS